MNHILLVEDDAAIAQSVLYALKREQFITDWVSLGEDALSFVQHTIPSLMLLDVGLPDQTGFDICKKIRHLYPNIPIIFLTAQTDEIDRVIGFELGADDYISKPFSPRELMLRIKAVLRRQQTTTNTPTEHHAIFYHDTEKARIYFQQQPLLLTKSEYVLLATLIAHPQRVFSRELLLERLGSVSENSTDRAIDTHIKELRAKLRAINPEQDIIITHRGLGYSVITS